MIRILRRALVAAVPLLLPLAAGAQSRDITGRVTQAGTEVPLAEVTVSVVGQTIGTLTNERGEFRLRVPVGDIVLAARQIGYRRVTARVTADQSTVNFQLERDVLQLEGVTVTGQATTTDRRVAATAVATVSSAELNRVPARSVESNLAGKVAGARIFENSGAPGGGAQIQIRGATSVLGQGDPLYVVDGVIISNASNSSGGSSITRAQRLGGVEAGPGGEPPGRHQPERHREHRSAEVGGGQRHLRLARHERRGGDHHQARARPARPTGTSRSAWARRRCSARSSSRQFRHARPTCRPWVGGPVGLAAATRGAATPTAPTTTGRVQLYGRTDPVVGNDPERLRRRRTTRASSPRSNDRQESGIMINTGARRTGGRINLDQTIGTKLTASIGLDVTRNFLQRGLGNNDNAGMSPTYLFGYTPAIVDLPRATRRRGATRSCPSTAAARARPIRSRCCAPSRSNETVWRQSGNIRLGYNAVATDRHIGAALLPGRRGPLPAGRLPVLAQLPAVRAGRRLPGHGGAEQHRRASSSTRA